MKMTSNRDKVIFIRTSEKTKQQFLKRVAEYSEKLTASKVGEILIKDFIKKGFNVLAEDEPYNMK